MVFVYPLCLGIHSLEVVTTRIFPLIHRVVVENEIERDFISF